MPLYDFRCSAGHVTELRVEYGVEVVACACGQSAERERVFRIAGQMGRPQGTPIAHFAEAAQEAQHRHDSTDDPTVRAATRPDVWRPALQRAKTKQFDKAMGVSNETHWTDPRPKLSDKQLRAEVG